MTTPRLDDITFDTSGIESDGSRWHGRLAFTCGDSAAVATWNGYDRSEDGQLVDVEGEDEAFCERIDGLKDQVERVASAALGVPHEHDVTGLWGALEAVAQARAIKAA